MSGDFLPRANDKPTFCGLKYSIFELLPWLHYAAVSPLLFYILRLLNLCIFLLSNFPSPVAFSPHLQMNTPPGNASLNVTMPDLATGGCAISTDIFQHPPAVEAPANSPFSLDQNYPNPFEGETTVPFTLNTAADVRLYLLDLSGRKVAGVVRKGRAAGAQSIKLNLRGLGLPAGDYLYQLQVSCEHGVFYQRLRMTAE